MALRLTAETIDSGVVSGTLSRKIVGEVEISSRQGQLHLAERAFLGRRAASFGSRCELWLALRAPRPLTKPNDTNATHRMVVACLHAVRINHLSLDSKRVNAALVI